MRGGGEVEGGDGGERSGQSMRSEGGSEVGGGSAVVKLPFEVRSIRGVGDGGGFGLLFFFFFILSLLVIRLSDGGEMGRERMVGEGFDEPGFVHHTVSSLTHLSQLLVFLHQWEGGRRRDREEEDQPPGETGEINRVKEDTSGNAMC